LPFLDRYYGFHERLAPQNQVTYVEPRPGHKHKGTLIWLHGIGELPDEYFGPLMGDPVVKLKAYLHPAMPGFRLVVPRARMRPVQMAGDARSYVLDQSRVKKMN
jgi:predicted esterase